MASRRSGHRLRMDPIDVRELAAVDMHGAKGTMLRRRVILAEFLLGALGGLAFGAWSLFVLGGAFGIVIGIWLLGIGANYVALSRHALALSRRGALDAELQDVAIRPALRHYTARQFWVFVPLALPWAEVSG